MDRNSNSTHFHHQVNGQNTPVHFNFNRENQELENRKVEQDVYIAKQFLFEKPLTPSDVGRLNRLVIPKQYAEMYFPLSGGSHSVEKGILLSFEDESSGKTWQFRYSYWNSSQSYVFTKGWSHFVKEKRLVAGDIVVFKRCCDGGGRLSVGWRHQIAPGVAESGYADAPGRGGSGSGGEQNQTTGSGHFKTLRLFGVNLECQVGEPVAADGSNHNESQARDYQPHFHSNEKATISKIHHYMQDNNFSTDVKKMRRFH